MNRFMAIFAAVAVTIGLTSGAAMAVTVNVNGHDWYTQTFTGSYNDNVSLLQSQVWWGDESAARSFAEAYQPFATSGIVDFAWAFDENPGSTSYFISCYGNSSYNPPEVVFPCFEELNPLATYTFATATKFSPVPLPAGGLLLLTGLMAAAGLGYRKKRAG